MSTRRYSLDGFRLSVYCASKGSVRELLPGQAHVEGLLSTSILEALAVITVLRGAYM